MHANEATGVAASTRTGPMPTLTLPARSTHMNCDGNVALRTGPRNSGLVLSKCQLLRFIERVMHGGAHEPRTLLTACGGPRCPGCPMRWAHQQAATRWLGQRQFYVPLPNRRYRFFGFAQYGDRAVSQVRHDRGYSIENCGALRRQPRTATEASPRVDKPTTMLRA